MNAPEGEETIFAEALRLPPEERTAYLDHATAGNPTLRQEVEFLLGSYATGDFLEELAARQLRPTRHTTVPLTEKPGETIGRYKLREQIGEGGCGVVYVAEQTEPVRRRVALKLIKLGMDTKSVIARFEAERQALALMDHPNIAKVFDAGATETGRPYFVMELVRGIKITEFCDEKKLSTKQRLDLFIHVCQAIQHAHQKGIIHRDIKPSNILVTVNDGVAVPKVIDFGIAKATSGQQLTDKTIYTAFEQFIGTPAYMSPEQAVLTSLDIDTRSDIYALGVLLYEPLTGRTPFDGKELLAIGLDEMRRTIREQEPPRPSTRLSTLPGHESSTTAQRRGLDAPKLVSELRGDLDWIVMKALEKDRARRYETANGLAADVQRHLNNEPVVACPPSRVYRFQKLLRRNRLAFAAGAAVAIVLVLGILASTWQATRARRAEQAAKAERDSAEAVQNFFREKVLAAGRPDELGKDVTLRKAVDAAEPQITAIFQNRPVVEAAIRHTLGETYKSLGEPALAVQQMERALALRRQHLGIQHPDTLTAMDELAMAYWWAGRGAKTAVPLLEETLKLRTSQLGTDHSDTFLTMNHLVDAYLFGDQLQKALPLAQTAFASQKAKLGPDHPQTLAAALNLGKINMWWRGHVDQGLELIEETLKIRKRTLGPDHADTLAAMQEFGYALAWAGKLEKAIPIQKETLELKTAKLGPEHPATLFSMCHLAHSYRRAGKLNDALPLFEQTFNGRKSRLGPEHFDTRNSMKELVSAYQEARKMDKAEALLLDSYEKLQKESTDEKYTRNVLQQFVRLYEAWDKPDKRAEWQKTLELFDKGQKKSSASESNAAPAETK